jgi:hypothetical protein
MNNVVLISVTVDDVMSWDLCEKYTRERVTALFAGRKTITALDVLDMDIPAIHRFWALLKMIPDPILYEFACQRAEGEISEYGILCADDDECIAWSAAYEAARDAAQAARGAAKGAARDAAWETAWKAAWEEMCRTLCRMLEEARHG